MSSLRNIALVMACLPLPAMAVDSKSFNSKDPIEITSDTLQVEQQDNVATFTGNVVAIQKDVRLRSDRMVVYYSSAEEKKGDAQKQTVKKIDVEGNVFLENPSETASGDRGDYDVEGQLIHLYDNVVLTNGANVLKGNELTYNFATGRSVITGGAAGVGTTGGRVRALFVPENAKDQNPKPNAAPAGKKP